MISSSPMREVVVAAARFATEGDLIALGFRTTRVVEVDSRTTRWRRALTVSTTLERRERILLRFLRRRGAGRTSFGLGRTTTLSASALFALGFETIPVDFVAALGLRTTMLASMARFALRLLAFGLARMATVAGEVRARRALGFPMGSWRFTANETVLRRRRRRSMERRGPTSDVARRNSGSKTAGEGG